jgi:hypothetical protein
MSGGAKLGSATATEKSEQGPPGASLDLGIDTAAGFMGYRRA